MEDIELFRLFIDSDEDDIRVKTPFVLDNRIYATDKKAAIRCLKSETNVEYSAHENTLKANAVYPEPNCNHIVDFSDINFDRYRDKPIQVKVGKDQYCSECNGDGEVEWEYESYTKYDDCPKCNGSGYQNEAKFVDSEIMGFGNYDVKFNNTRISVYYIDILNKISKSQQKPIVLKNITLENKCAMFEIGRFEIIVMPVVVHDWTDGSETIKLIEIK